MPAIMPVEVVELGFLEDRFPPFAVRKSWMRSFRRPKTFPRRPDLRAIARKASKATVLRGICRTEPFFVSRRVARRA